MIVGSSGSLTPMPRAQTMVAFACDGFGSEPKPRTSCGVSPGRRDARSRSSKEVSALPSRGPAKHSESEDLSFDDLRWYGQRPEAIPSSEPDSAHAEETPPAPPPEPSPTQSGSPPGDESGLGARAHCQNDPPTRNLALESFDRTLQMRFIRHSSHTLWKRRTRSHTLQLANGVVLVRGPSPPG